MGRTLEKLTLGIGGGLSDNAPALGWGAQDLAVVELGLHCSCAEARVRLDVKGRLRQCSEAYLSCWFKFSLVDCFRFAGG